MTALRMEYKEDYRSNEVRIGKGRSWEQGTVVPPPRTAVLQWQKGRTVSLPPRTAVRGPVPWSTAGRADVHGYASLVCHDKCCSGFAFSGGSLGWGVKGASTSDSLSLSKPH